MAEASGSISNWWRDMVNVVLALWLIVSPWNLKLMDVSAATTASITCGVILLALAVATLTRAHPIQEWGKILVGAWLVLSPFVLGYAGVPTLLVNHLLMAVAVIAVSASALRVYYRRKESIITGARWGRPDLFAG